MRSREFKQCPGCSRQILLRDPACEMCLARVTKRPVDRLIHGTPDDPALFNVWEEVKVRDAKISRLCRIEQVGDPHLRHVGRVEWWDRQYIVRPLSGYMHAVPIYESDIDRPRVHERYFQILNLSNMFKMRYFRDREPKW